MSQPESPPIRATYLPTTWMEVVVVLVCAVVILALRLHTLTEPVDCDEAAYGYVAWRVLKGERLYVDVFENKPPLAYAPFAGAIALGGFGERAVRLLPLPFVLLTLIAVWRSARLIGRTRGIGALAAFVYAWAQSDPFVFGNGANLEIYMNACLASALWGLFALLAGTMSLPLVLLVGILIGSAAAIKQVAGVYLVPAAIACAVLGHRQRKGRGAIMSTLCLVGGALLPWALCAAFCWWQGGLAQFFEAVFVYAPEVSRVASEDVLQRVAFSQPASLPLSPAVAAVTGGLSDRPFLYLMLFLLGNPLANAWWAAGIWPLLLLLLVSFTRCTLPGTSGLAKLFFGWVLATVVAIVWPGLFWQHYYMLLVPVASIGAALETGWIPRYWSAVRQLALPRRALWRLYCIATVVAVLVLCANQYRYYLKRSPEQITSLYKGGRQWVALRKTAQGLRKGFGSRRTLFVWGWQSPLYLYTNWPAPTPYFFTDPLLQKFVDRSHPLADQRKRRILADLTARPPDVVFVGEKPFPELTRFLRNRYLAVTDAHDGRGLFVHRSVLLQYTE